MSERPRLSGKSEEKRKGSSVGNLSGGEEGGEFRRGDIGLRPSTRNRSSRWSPHCGRGHPTRPRKGKRAKSDCFSGKRSCSPERALHSPTVKSERGGFPGEGKRFWSRSFCGRRLWSDPSQDCSEPSQIRSGEYPCFPSAKISWLCSHRLGHPRRREEDRHHHDAHGRRHGYRRYSFTV